jgi:hypothetical protein
MLVWMSCQPDGSDDRLSTHGSRPMPEGAAIPKWNIANFVYNVPAEVCDTPHLPWN